MDPVTAYLGLGSNLGRREENLATAMGRLTSARGRPIPSSLPETMPENLGVQILRASSIYETSPWGVEDQPEFLNCVLEICTRLSPSELLTWVKVVEQEMGRQQGPRYGPRLIDVDILLYGCVVVDLPDLQIPHPRLHLRAFAMIPLAELDRRLVHPTLHATAGELAAQVDGREGVKVWGPPPKTRHVTA